MVLGLALLFGTAAARHAMPQEAPTFPAGIELVRIDVVAIDLTVSGEVGKLHHVRSAVEN